ncbi:MAG: hypothetical protein QME74_07830 [Candidatus Edwardsbacteria bacterium]|nr:hypothetical protein [Candidatus Edwardsbacteria bacterium]
MVSSRGNQLSAQPDPNQLLARLTSICGSFNRVVESLGPRTCTEVDLAALAVCDTCGLFQSATVTPDAAGALLPRVRALKLSLPKLLPTSGAWVLMALDALIADLESKCPVNPADLEKGSEE